jgi:hypothetical protein
MRGFSEETGWISRRFVHELCADASRGIRYTVRGLCIVTIDPILEYTMWGSLNTGKCYIDEISKRKVSIVAIGIDSVMAVLRMYYG